MGVQEPQSRLCLGTYRPHVNGPCKGFGLGLRVNYQHDLPALKATAAFLSE